MRTLCIKGKSLSLFFLVVSPKILFGVLFQNFLRITNLELVLQFLLKSELY